jgi:hypothetical protein
MKEIALEAVGGKTLIYGGREDQPRTEYRVWRSGE